MKISHTNQIKAASASAVALTLAMVACQAVIAQDASSTGSWSGSSALGADQDSLLPPEVVPLDPATASSMSQAQADKRQSSFGGQSVASEGTVNQVPGLVNTGVPSGMQSAKDFRAAAFNSLYGQGQIPQQPLQAAGGVNQNYILGDNGTGMNGSGSAPYGTTTQAAMPTQSQRLTGASKIQPKTRDIRRAGFSNTLSAVAGFGAGALTAGALMRPTSPMMGMGLFGLTMTGFGVRNAFRF